MMVTSNGTDSIMGERQLIMAYESDQIEPALAMTMGGNPGIQVHYHPERIAIQAES